VSNSVDGEGEGGVSEAVVLLLTEAIGGSGWNERRSRGERMVDASVLVTGFWCGDVAAACALQVSGRSARLTALAVDAHLRGRGIGRAVVDAVMANLDVDRLDAETDGEAVGFYRSCGFDVTSLGQKYPGVERFAVTRATS
jgi:ribosomal protein S18 acetylase RimI-like enzyme